MTHGLADEHGRIAESAAEDILNISQEATALALGPGLGRSAELADLVARLYRDVAKPVVVDADALVALSQHGDSLRRPGGPRILTPHPGEFARLSGRIYDAANRMEAAATLAQRDATKNTLVVLKGHRTVVTDGMRVSVNQSGNPGMATGGTGDVLTGIITALLCQGLEPFDAARLGVHLHGLAGDLAAQEVGQVSLIASDLIDYLPRAFRAIS
jgi:NAD(P)H-hydrate epimerase